MSEAFPTTRRLLLGQGCGIALLLPAAALAASSRRRHPASAPVAARLIVIDPGHGGKDPGAIGASGTSEKHVTFAAAVELARQLRASGRYRVSMTRENDVFIPLEDRVAIARANGAALFISLHADAVADRDVRGASVYTLAANASDAQSAGLAAHENDADHVRNAVAGVSPHVADILNSLLQHETRLGSARLQREVVGALGADIRLLDNPARHAGFAVLKAGDVPSVLIEMGFISNPQDEVALQQAGHRTLVAAAIRRAVDGFFSA